MQITSAHKKVFEPLLRPDRSGRPKHLRLTNTLAQAIISGHWKAGDKLPTEEELVELTPFSLGTVQRALRNLVDQDIIVRRHGLGTFVADTKLLLKNPWHCQFLDDDGETLLPVYSKALTRERVTQPGAWTGYFLHSAGYIILIERMVTVNNEFNVLARFFGDSRMLPFLWDAPLKTLDGLNFKNLITKELNVPITRITHQVRVEKFDKHVAAIIGVNEGEVGIILQAEAYMGDADCVYYEEFFIPMTHRRLSISGQTTALMRAPL